MQRSLLVALPVLGLLLGGLVAADDKETKDKDAPKHRPATVVKVDAKKGELTVRYTDAKGKEQEKTYQLTKEVHLTDETGRPVHLDVFQSGNDVYVLETEGRLRELRRAVRPHEGRRLSDAVKTLIEMTDSGDGYTGEVQRIYDMLRKLDTAKNGTIDPAALKAAREQILEERIDDLIKRLDTNKDGKVSREEAKGWVKEHFDRIDANKDGFIERNELLKAAREWHASKTSQPEKK